MALSLRDRSFVKSKKLRLKSIVLVVCWQAAIAFCPAFGQDADSLKRREALLTDEAERYVAMALRDGLIGEWDADSLRQKCRIQAGDGVRIVALREVMDTIDDLYDSAFSLQKEPAVARRLDKSMFSRMLPGILMVPEEMLSPRERRQIQEVGTIRRVNDDNAKAVALPDLSPLDEFFLHIARYFFNHHPEDYGKVIPMNGGIYTIRVPERPHLPGGKELTSNTYETNF
ncbi:MAG: hypothetical protein IJK79_01040 [Bacteroidales bacterium]|nr:hypothetical protein [Bacteroidales bacterium]